MSVHSLSKLVVIAALTAGLATASSFAHAAGQIARVELKPFNVTVRVFDPAKGLESGQDYVLPVDSPDAEHAAASTMSNAVSFTRKTENGKALSVAFTCVKVEPR